MNGTQWEFLSFTDFLNLPGVGMERNLLRKFDNLFINVQILKIFMVTLRHLDNN